MDKLILFRIKNKLLGIESSEVKEIAELIKIFPLPFSISSLKGLTFFRGNIKTIISSKALVDEPNNNIDGGVFIGLRRYENLMIEAEKIEESIEFNPFKMKREEGIYNPIYKGFYPFEEEFVSIIDVENMVSSIEEDVLKTIKFGSSWR